MPASDDFFDDFGDASSARKISTGHLNAVSEKTLSRQGASDTHKLAGDGAGASSTALDDWTSSLDAFGLTPRKTRQDQQPATAAAQSVTALLAGHDAQNNSKPGFERDADSAAAVDNLSEHDASANVCQAGSDAVRQTVVAHDYHPGSEKSLEYHDGGTPSAVEPLGASNTDSAPMVLPSISVASEVEIHCEQAAREPEWRDAEPTTLSPLTATRPLTDGSFSTSAEELSAAPEPEAAVVDLVDKNATGAEKTISPPHSHGFLNTIADADPSTANGISSNGGTAHDDRCGDGGGIDDGAATQADDRKAAKELRILLDERERQLERLGQQAADAARQVSVSPHRPQAAPPLCSNWETP